MHLDFEDIIFTISFLLDQNPSCVFLTTYQVRRYLVFDSDIGLQCHPIIWTKHLLYRSIDLYTKWLSFYFSVTNTVWKPCWKSGMSLVKKSNYYLFAMKKNSLITNTILNCTKSPKPNESNVEEVKSCWKRNLIDLSGGFWFWSKSRFIRFVCSFLIKSVTKLMAAFCFYIYL